MASIQLAQMKLRGNDEVIELLNGAETAVVRFARSG